MNSEKLKKHKTKIISSLVTLVILSLLFLAGPAQAFVMELTDFSNDKPIQGQDTIINASIDINSNERIQIPYINLMIDENIVCTFNASTGEPFAPILPSSVSTQLIPNNCLGISIEVLSNNPEMGNGYGYAYGYGYGYGYNYGHSDTTFEYQITMNTSYDSQPGTKHELQLQTLLGSQEYTSDIKEFTVGVKAPTDNEIFDDIGFLLPENQTNPENISNITTNNDWEISQGTGNSSVSIPSGTIISKENKEKLNLSEFTAENTSISDLSGLSNMIGALKLGIPNFGLVFSQPITIKIYVGTDYNGETLDIYRSTSGSSGWTQDGLVDNTCLVSSGICEFKTKKASYYSTTEQSSETNDDTSTSGGSSYCVTEWDCSNWGPCVDGQQTRVCTYPSTFCEPTQEKPRETRVCTINEDNEAELEDEEDQGFFAGLTGAFIGTLGTTGSILFLGLVLAILIGIYFLVRHLRKK